MCVIALLAVLQASAQYITPSHYRMRASAQHRALLTTCTVLPDPMPQQLAQCPPKPWTLNTLALQSPPLIHTSHRRLAVLPTNLAGSKVDRLRLGLPCRINAAKASPVAGPFRMPQQLCPDATYTPSTPGNLRASKTAQKSR